MMFLSLVLNPYLMTSFRLLLAVVFLLSAIGKIRNLGKFEESVRDYKLLSRNFVGPFSNTLPWIEIILSFLIFVGWRTAAAASLSAALFLLFNTAIGINLIRGRNDIDCGCFGSKHKIGIKIILRNIVLLAISFLILFGGGGYLSYDTLPISVQINFKYSIFYPVIFPSVLILIGIYLTYKILIRLLQITAFFSSE